MVPPVPQQPEPRAIILPWAPPPSGTPRSAMRKMRMKLARKQLRPGEIDQKTGGKFEPKAEPELNEFIANQFKDDYGERHDGIGRSTGFLTPDGEGIPMGPGERYEDHRAALPSSAAMKRWKWPAEIVKANEQGGGRTQALFELMRRSGAARIHSGGGNLIVHLASPPTDQQKRAIVQHVSSERPENVIISHVDGAEHSLSMPASHEVMHALENPVDDGDEPERYAAGDDDGMSMDFDSMGEDELPKAPLQRPAPKEDITGRTRKQILQQMLEAARKGHYDPSGMMPRDYIQDIENKDDVPQGGGDVFMSDPEDELPDRPAKMGRVRYARFPEQPPMLGRKDLKARWTEFTSDPDVDNRIWNHPAGNTSGGYNTSGSFSTVHSDDLRSHVKRLDDAGLNTHSHPMIRNDLQANRDEFGSHEVVVSPQMTAYAEKERRKPAGHFNDLIGTRLRFDHGVDHVGRPNALTHVFPPNQPTKMSRIGYPRRMARSSPEDTEALFKATQASPDDHNLRNALADTLANNGHPKSVIEHLRSGLPVWVGKSPKGVINAIPFASKQAMSATDSWGRPRYGSMYHATSRNRKGQAHGVRVSGKMQTWKTRPDEFRIPWKFGLYDNGELNHRNFREWLLDDPTQEPT